MAKKILITGIPRSGSTWQYNVVRLALIEAGFKVYGCWIEDYNIDLDSDFHVIKLHEFDRFLAEDSFLTFTSQRNVKQVQQSMTRFRKQPYEYEKAVKLFNNWKRWIFHSHYLTKFEDLVNNREGEVARIINVLSSKIPKLATINPSIIAKKVDNLIVPKGDVDTYDKITLLHPNHITRK